MNLLRSLVKSDLLIFGLVFSTIFLVAVIHVIRQPLLYEATATMELKRNMGRPGAWLGSVEELYLDVSKIQSLQMVKKVVVRLSADDRASFFKPYGRIPSDMNDALVGEVIRDNRTIHFDSGNLTFNYHHPDRRIAAQIANLYVDEVIAYEARLRIDDVMRQLEDLKPRVKAQDLRMKELNEEITAYREQNERNTGKIFEPDAGYETLQQKQVLGLKFLDALIHRMRDLSMGFGMNTGSWLPDKRAVPPNESDYLITPIVVRLSWGFVFAVVGGLLAVGVGNIFTRGRELADNQKEAA